MAPILQPTFTSPPLKNQALPAQGQQLEEFILCSMLNGYVQKCSGKEGVGGGGKALPLFKDTQKEGVLAMLWTPAMNSRVLPAVLQDWKGTSLPWRGAETEVGGAFRAQRAVKW